MTTSLENARDRFIDGIARMSDAFGLNRFVIQLYIFLYLSGTAISLDEIAKSLGVSKGNVSINIRELEKWGAVKKVWVKGSRKDYYEADPEIKKVFGAKIKSAIERRLTGLSGLMDDFIKNMESGNGNLSDDDKAKAKTYNERLKKIKELKNFASAALAIASKLL